MSCWVYEAHNFHEGVKVGKIDENMKMGENRLQKSIFRSCVMVLVVVWDWFVVSLGVFLGPEGARGWPEGYLVLLEPRDPQGGLRVSRGVKIAKMREHRLKNSVFRSCVVVLGVVWDVFAVGWVWGWGFFSSGRCPESGLREFQPGAPQPLP